MSQAAGWIGELREDRIGHLAGNTELHCRRGGRAVFVAYSPANRQLLKMWKRRLPVIESYLARRLFIALKPILKRTSLYYELPQIPVAEAPEFTYGEPSLSFTDEEHERGRAELKRMGIDTWFVCFHARDAAYLSRRRGFGRTTGQPSYFDCSIRSYYESMKMIEAKGGAAIRMGALVDERMPEFLQRGRIVDYATKHRTDFMDVYLPAHCKFFVGSSSGLFNVARIFNVPYLLTNLAPFPWVGKSGPRNLDIPKLLRRKGDGSFLTFRELRDLDLLDASRDEPEKLKRLLDPATYDHLGLRWHDNDETDIVDAVNDMLQKLDGQIQCSGIAPSFRKRWAKLFDPA